MLPLTAPGSLLWPWTWVSVHVLALSLWVSSRFSGLIPPPKNMPVGGLDMLNCPLVWMNACKWEHIVCRYRPASYVRCIPATTQHFICPPWINKYLSFLKLTKGHFLCHLSTRHWCITYWYIKYTTGLCQVCEITSTMHAVNKGTGIIHYNSKTDFLTDVPLIQGAKLLVI